MPAIIQFFTLKIRVSVAVFFPNWHWYCIAA